LSQKTLRIISRYGQITLLKGFLFPILDKRVHRTALLKQNRIREILGKVDKD